MLLQNFTYRYISRFDDRLAEIDEQNELNKARGRHGRYHAAEEEGIKMVKQKEEELFNNGKFGKKNFSKLIFNTKPKLFFSFSNQMRQTGASKTVFFSSEAFLTTLILVVPNIFIVDSTAI